VAAALKSHAADVPSPMSVNMLRRPVRIETQARSRKGQPPHSTTGVESASWTAAKGRKPRRWRTAIPAAMSPMARASSATVGASPHQNLRLMLASSGFTGSSADGNPPTTSGSSAMPQIGQGTGRLSLTSGSMGQTQITSPPGGAAGGAALAAPPAPRERKLAGSAENFARHFGLQK